MRQVNTFVNFAALRSLRSVLVPVAASLAMVALSACTTNRATGEQSFTAFMSEEEEKRVGKTEHPKVLDQFGGNYDFRGLWAYVSAVGAKLVAVSELANQRFTFTVLDSDMVNAFALPGGYVYVTRGVVALASNEAELAGILGHEIGHVVARHTAQRYSQGMAAGVGAAVLGVLLGDAAGTLAQYGAAAYLQSFSRDQEFEADTLGVRYLARAGYDPSAMAAFLSKLKAVAEYEARKAGRRADDGIDIMATHPRTAERVERAIADARASVVPNPAINRDAYLDRIDGMLYGDNPERGVVRGRAFLHPLARVRFDAPPGFDLRNAEDAVIGLGPNGVTLVFSAHKDLGMSASDMVRHAASKFGLRSIDRLQMAGLESATSAGTVATGDGRPVVVRVLATRLPTGYVGNFLFVAPLQSARQLDLTAQAVVDNFRMLLPQQAAEFKSSHLSVVKVESPDEAERLANTMAVDRDGRRLFEILNGLSPGELPKPGDRVKVVR